jgi:hypothetical protein
MRRPPAISSTIATAASRSAVPVAAVISAATTRPLRFSITTCPMWHSRVIAPLDKPMAIGLC